MKAVLDACVLFPTVTRGLLLDAARVGVFVPLWSTRIVSEWTHAARRDTPAGLVDAESALLHSQWPDALITVPEGAADGLSLPDPDDTHVLAAAITARAEAIVTFNLRDFPPRTLAGHAITPWHPDVFLLAALAEAGDLFATALHQRIAPMRATGMSARQVLKKARLPRLAKAIEAHA